MFPASRLVSAAIWHPWNSGTPGSSAIPEASLSHPCILPSVTVLLLLPTNPRSCGIVGFLMFAEAPCLETMRLLVTAPISEFFFHLTIHTHACPSLTTARNCTSSHLSTSQPRWLPILTHPQSSRPTGPISPLILSRQLKLTTPRTECLISTKLFLCPHLCQLSKQANQSPSCSSHQSRRRP